MIDVLMLSGDAKVLDKKSAVYNRMALYAKNINSLTVFVSGKNKDTTKSESNLRIVGTGIENRLFSLFVIFVKVVFFIFKKSKKSEKLIITTQDPFALGFIGTIMSMLFKIPIEIQVHTDLLGIISNNGKWRKYVSSFSLNRANSIRVVSQKVKDGILSINQNLEEKINILPIIPPNFIPENCIFNKNEKIVLVVSRLEEEKDVEYALRFFRKILDEVRDVKLRIAGEGSLYEHLKQMTFKYGISDSVVFLGHVDDMVKEYAKATILLHTAKFEGFGLVFLEAGLCGLPIVSTDVGIAKDIGAIVINRDGLVSKDVILLLSDEKRWTEISKRVLRGTQKIALDKDVYIEKIIASWNNLGSK